VTRTVGFLIPGDLDLPTGGYAYDRALLAHLPALGVAPIHVELPGSFPDPTVADLEVSAARVAALPEGCPLLVDGLAYGAMPVDLVRRFARPVVALCHHPLAFESGLSAVRAADLRASETAALALARRVIVTSAATGRLLVEAFAVPPERLVVAPPGTIRRPRATGSEGSRVEILAVGAVVPRKGYDVLIEAIAGLADRDWRLTIVGAERAPAHRADLDRRIAAAGLAGRIRFLGAVDADELDALHATADLFVAPSRFEGYGMALAEALQRGLPIVTSTGGAAAETVPEGAGLEVPPGDAPALAVALARALDDADLRRDLAAAAFAAGAGLPRWEDTARVVATCLGAVAEGGA
jgi:glycosyltransferase involved in cell wall biosynthesis